MSQQTILDMCCGSRMFWFNKQDSRTVFADIRAEEHTLCDGRRLVISPDLIADFRALPFADSSFPVVVFDPPHLERVGQTAWMGKKYGHLNKKTWRADIRAGFKEAFRVLRPHGVLIFKWNETQIPVSQILALTDVKPIIGQRTGKNDKTHWIIFVKDYPMTTITKERIELFVKSPLENGLTRGEQMDLARIALASLEAEPIGYMNRFTGRVFSLDEQPGADTDTDVYEPVYAAPPAPVVPDGYALVPVEPTDEMIAAAMNCEDVMFNSDESFCVQFGNIYEAMLAAAPQK